MSLKSIQTSSIPRPAVFTRSQNEKVRCWSTCTCKTTIAYSKIMLSPFSMSLNRTSSNSSAPQPAPP